MFESSRLIECNYMCNKIKIKIKKTLYNEMYFKIVAHIHNLFEKHVTYPNLLCCVVLCMYLLLICPLGFCVVCLKISTYII